MFDHFARYLAWRTALEDPFVELDATHSGLSADDLTALAPGFQRAFEAMKALEAGGIANPDEQRMVGHYWLRAPALAPDDDTSDAISNTLAAIEEFATKVHSRAISPPGGDRFRRVLVVGIGGSALGPMFVGEALDPVRDGGIDPEHALDLEVFDNTDPDGIDRRLEAIDLATTLVIVISKSGGTPETRNGMLEIQAACARAGVEFGPRAVAITTEGSALSERAKAEAWLAEFPMWDWVGGRTSELSAVGLLPAALCGVDVRAVLAGAAAMDAETRNEDVRSNPAALLAAFWHVQGSGVGERAMVVLPYKDRLVLFSRYLQQLVMESLGKRLDRAGREVCQGLTVYGNKGSTDQHAYVQQLRDGRHDFFAVFVRVLQDRHGPSMVVDGNATSGDFLDGFLQGSREALFEAGRQSVTLTVQRSGPRTIGALIALFERAVGLYAELIDTNAYHQPGVEAGKKAAAAVLAKQDALLEVLTDKPNTAPELAASLADVNAYDAWQILRHLAANRDDIRMHGAPVPESARFSRGS